VYINIASQKEQQNFGRNIKLIDHGLDGKISAATAFYN